MVAQTHMVAIWDPVANMDTNQGTFFKQIKWQLLSQHKKISLRQWHLRNVEFITSSMHLPIANSTSSWPSLHVFSAFVLTWNTLKIYLLVLSLLRSSHKQNGMDTKLSLISPWSKICQHSYKITQTNSSCQTVPAFLNNIGFLLHCRRIHNASANELTKFSYLLPANHLFTDLLVCATMKSSVTLVWAAQSLHCTKHIGFPLSDNMLRRS